MSSSFNIFPDFIFLLILNQNWRLASNPAKFYIFSFHCPQVPPVFSHLPDSSFKNANMFGSTQKFLGPSGNNRDQWRWRVPNLINQLSQVRLKPQTSVPVIHIFFCLLLSIPCLHLKLQLRLTLPFIIFCLLHQICHTHENYRGWYNKDLHLPTPKFHKYYLFTRHFLFNKWNTMDAEKDIPQWPNSLSSFFIGNHNPAVVYPFWPFKKCLYFIHMYL